MTTLKLEKICDESRRTKLCDYLQANGDKSPNIIRILNVTAGKYFVSFGADAELICRELTKSTDLIRYDDTELKEAYVIFDRRQYEVIVRTLFGTESKTNRSLEFWTIENDENGRFEKKLSGSLANRMCFEDFLSAAAAAASEATDDPDRPLLHSSNVFLAVYFLPATANSSRHLSLCVLDRNEFEISFYEFDDNEFANDFEKILIQSNPNEVILPEPSTNNSIFHAAIVRVLQRNQIACNTIERKLLADFAADNFRANFERLLYFETDDQRNLSVIERVYEITENGMRSFRMLDVRFADDLMSNETNHNRFRVVPIAFRKSVYLNTAALKALNLLPNSSNDITNTKKRNLFDLLNNCCTPQGKRLLEKWIRQPSIDWREINNRLNCVQELCENHQLIYERTGKLSSIGDLLEMVHKIYRKHLSLKNLFRMYQALKLLNGILQTVDDMRTLMDDDKFGNLDTIFFANFRSLLTRLEPFHDLIESNIDMKSIADSGEYLIDSRKNPELNELKEEMQKLDDEANEEYERVLRELKKCANESDDTADLRKLVKFDASSSQRKYQLRLPLRKESLIKQKSTSAAIRVIDTSKTSIRFTTETLAEHQTHYNRLIADYETKQSSIVAEIVDDCEQFCANFLRLNNAIAKFDVIVSFAYAAVTAPKPYRRPQLVISKTKDGVSDTDGVRDSEHLRFVDGQDGDGERRHLRLEQARHPCMEIQENVSFIANDTEFEAGTNLLHVITGPNMAGKSTYVRTVGVICLMAHLGSFVPCDRAAIPIFDSIHARIGSSDSYGAGLSTFMVEMTEMVSILRNSSDRSLVIIDELCRGTSTFEGVGLAWAIARKLALEIQSFSLFATHFHELTDIRTESAAIWNFHTAVLVDSESDELNFLYTIRPGSIDRSFGIQVAKLIGFPDEIIEHAKKIQKQLDLFANENFTNLFASSTGNEMDTGIETVQPDTDRKRETIRSADSLLEKFFASIKTVLERHGCKNDGHDDNRVILRCLQKLLANGEHKKRADILRDIKSLKIELGLDENLLLKQFSTS